MTADFEKHLFIMWPWCQLMVIEMFCQKGTAYDAIVVTTKHYWFSSHLIAHIGRHTKSPNEVILIIVQDQGGRNPDSMEETGP